MLSSKFAATCRVVARTRLSVVIVSASLVMLVGCNASQRLMKDRLQFANSAEEVGSTHIAVLSVAPWSDAESELQPKFQISETEALNLVLPNTRQLLEASAQRTGIGVNLQPPVSTRTTTATTAADGSVTLAEQRFEGPAGGHVNAPGADGTLAPVGQYPGSNLPTAPATTFVSPGSLPTEAVGTSPLLKYQAANALYQEIRAMNQTVVKAARRQGYRPFLVRMQISVMPSSRRRPYDALVNLSFFARNPVPKRTPERFKQRELYESEIRSLASSVGGYLDAEIFQNVTEANTEQETAEKACAADTRSTDKGQEEDEQLSYAAESPVVVPLLVTDDLESTIREQSIEEIRQFALGLALLRANTGANFDFESYNSLLQKSRGKDYNSLMTVARLSDNTLRVRLGAMDRVDKTSVMVPRTHNVSVLLLAPCSTFHTQTGTIDVISATQFHSVVNGKALPTDGQSLSALQTVVNKLAALVHEEGQDIDPEIPTQAQFDKLKRLLSSPDASATRVELQALLAEMKSPVHRSKDAEPIILDAAQSRKLTSLVLEGNMDQLRNKIRLLIAPGMSNEKFSKSWSRYSAWAYSYLIEAIEKGARSFATFQVLSPLPPRLLLESERSGPKSSRAMPSVFDDGKVSVVTFRAGSALKLNALSAAFVVSGGNLSHEISLPADVELAGDESTIRVSRVSLTQSKFKGAPLGPEHKVKVQISCPLCALGVTDSYCPAGEASKITGSVQHEKEADWEVAWLDQKAAEPAPAEFTVHTFASTLYLRTPPKREVNLSFEVRYAKQSVPVFFRIEGADVASEGAACKPACLDPTSNGVVLAPGVISVPLINATDKVRLLAGIDLKKLKEVGSFEVK